MKNEAHMQHRAETSSSVALEMAHMRQSRHEGKTVSDDAFGQALARMMLSEAATTGDALALLVHAQMLLAAPLADLPLPTCRSEVHPIHCVNELVIKAIEAMETASGESREVYVGKRRRR